MAWVVDTCVLIDVADADATFGQASADALEKLLDEELVLSPVSYVELAPVFDGSERRLDDFLAGMGVTVKALMQEDVARAFGFWSKHVSEKRQGLVRRRPVADVFIAALASRVGGLVTRNPKDFSRLDPDLRLRDPSRKGK